MVQVTRPNSIEEQRRVASLSKKIGRIVTASDFERIAGSRVTAAASEAAFGHIASPDPLGNGGQADLMLLLRRMNKAIKKSLPLVAHGNSAFPIRDTGYRPDDGTENEHQGEHTERFLAHIENNHGAEAADEYRQSIQRGEVLTVANKYKEKTVQPGTRASEDADSDDCEHPGGDIDGFIHPEYRARGWDPDTKEFQGELAGLGVRDYYSEMYSRVYPKEIADQIVQGLFGDPTEENTRRPDMTTIRSERGRTQKEDRPYSDDEWAGIGDRQAPPKGRRLYGDEDRDVNTDDRRGEQRPVGDPDPEPVSSVPSAENPAPRVDPDLVKIDDVSPFRAFIKKARQYLKTKGDITPGKQAHALSRALLRGEISTKALSLIKQQATKEAISKNVRSQINQNEDPLEGMNKRTLGKYYRMAIQRIFSAAKKQAGSKKRVQRQEQSERTKTYMRTPSGPDRRAAIGQGDEGVDIGVGTGKPQAPDAEDNVEDEMEEEGGKYFIPGPDPDSGQRINVTSYVDENGNWIAGKPRPTRTENGGWIFKSLVKRLESALRKAAPEDPTSAVSTVVANERLNSGNKSIDDPKQAILNAVTQRTQANLTANGAQNKALTDPSGQAAWKTGFWRSGEKIYPHVASIQYADPERKDPYLSYDRNTDAWEGKLTRIHSGILHPAVVAGKVGYGLARAFASGLTGIDPHDIVSFAGDAVKDTTAVAQDTIGLLDRSKDWLKNTIGPKLGFKSKGGAADTTTTLPGGSGPNPLAGAYGLNFDAGNKLHNSQKMPLDQIKTSHPEMYEAIIAQHPATKVAYEAWVADPTAETRAALDASIHSFHREDRKTNILATMTPDQKGYIQTGKFGEVAKTPDGAKTIDKVLRHLMHDEIGASSLTPDDENSLKAAFLDPTTSEVGTILKDWAGLGAANDHEDVASRLRNALMRAHNTVATPESRQALAKLLGMTPEQSDQAVQPAPQYARPEDVQKLAQELHTKLKTQYGDGSPAGDGAEEHLDEHNKQKALEQRIAEEKAKAISGAPKSAMLESLEKMRGYRDSSGKTRIDSVIADMAAKGLTINETQASQILGHYSRVQQYTSPRSVESLAQDLHTVLAANRNNPDGRRGGATDHLLSPAYIQEKMKSAGHPVSKAQAAQIAAHYAIPKQANMEEKAIDLIHSFDPTFEVDKGADTAVQQKLFEERQKATDDTDFHTAAQEHIEQHPYIKKMTDLSNDLQSKKSTLEALIALGPTAEDPENALNAQNPDDLRTQLEDINGKQTQLELAKQNYAAHLKEMSRFGVNEDSSGRPEDYGGPWQRHGPGVQQLVDKYGTIPRGKEDDYVREDGPGHYHYAHDPSGIHKAIDGIHPNLLDLYDPPKVDKDGKLRYPVAPNPRKLALAITRGTPEATLALSMGTRAMNDAIRHNLGERFGVGTADYTTEELAEVFSDTDVSLQAAHAMTDERGSPGMSPEDWQGLSSEQQGREHRRWQKSMIDYTTKNNAKLIHEKRLETKFGSPSDSYTGDIIDRPLEGIRNKADADAHVQALGDEYHTLSSALQYSDSLSDVDAARLDRSGNAYWDAQGWAEAFDEGSVDATLSHITESVLPENRNDHSMLLLLRNRDSLSRIEAVLNMQMDKFPSAKGRELSLKIGKVKEARRVMDEAQGLKERTKNIAPEELKDIYPELHDELTGFYGRDPQGTTADYYLDDHSAKADAGSGVKAGTESSHVSDLMDKMADRGTLINEWQAADILAYYSRKPDESDGFDTGAPGGPGAPDGSGAPGGSGESPSGEGREEPPSVPFKWETHRDKSVQDFLDGIPDGGTTSARAFIKANPDAAQAIGLKSSLSEIHNDFYKLSDEISGSEFINNAEQDPKYKRRFKALAQTLKGMADFGEAETKLPGFESIHDITVGSSSNVSPVPMGRMLGKLLTGVTRIMGDSLEQAKDPVSDEQQGFRQEIFDKFKRTLAKQGITINIPEIGQQFDMRDIAQSFTVGVPDGETLDERQPVYVVSVSKPSVKHAVDQGHLTWKGATDAMPPQYKGQMIVSNTPPTESVIKDSLDSLSPPPDDSADPSTPDDAADLSRMSPDDLAAADLSSMSIDQLEEYRNALDNASKKLNDEIVASGRGTGTAEQQGMLTRLMEADFNAQTALRKHPDRTRPSAGNREITDADRAAFKEKVLTGKRARELAATSPNARVGAPEASNVTERVLEDMGERPSREMDASVGRAAEALRPVDDKRMTAADDATYAAMRSEAQTKRFMDLLGPAPFQRPSPSEDEVATLRQRANFSASLSRRIPRKFSKSSPSNDPKRLIMSIYNSL